MRLMALRGGWQELLGGDELELAHECRDDRADGAVINAGGVLIVAPRLTDLECPCLKFEE
jgi:hypothetical protein